MMNIELGYNQTTSRLLRCYRMIIEDSAIPVEIFAVDMLTHACICATWLFEGTRYLGARTTMAGAWTTTEDRVYRIKSDSDFVKTLPARSCTMSTDYNYNVRNVFASSHSEVICVAQKPNWILSTEDVLESDRSFWTILGLRTDKWSINGSKVMELRYYNVFQNFWKQIRGIYAVAEISTHDINIMPGLIGALIMSHMNFNTDS